MGGAACAVASVTGYPWCHVHHAASHSLRRDRGQLLGLVPGLPPLPGSALAERAASGSLP